jgi:hypothetical protein
MMPTLLWRAAPLFVQQARALLEKVRGRTPHLAAVTDGIHLGRPQQDHQYQHLLEGTTAYASFSTHFETIAI